MPESSQRSLQAKTSMDVSDEKKLQEEGFESWGMQRKVVQGKKRGVHVKFAENMKCTDERNDDIPSRRRPGRPKKAKIKSVTEEIGSRRRRSIEAVGQAEAEATIVISEKEYQMLQTMKDNLEEKNASPDEHVLKDRYVGRDGSAASKHRKKPISETDYVVEKDKANLRGKVALQETIDGRQEGAVKNVRGQAGIFYINDENDVSTDEIDGDGVKNNGVSRRQGQCSSDSEFDEIQEIRPVLGCNSALLEQSKRQNNVIDFLEEQVQQDSHERSTVVRFASAKENIHGRTNVCRQELTPKSLLAYRSARPSSPIRRPVKPKFDNFFPFEATVGDDNEDKGRLMSMSDSSAEVFFEDNLDGSPMKYRSQEQSIEKRVTTESEARANRKKKMVEREMAMQRREAAGEKPYYIMVSASGTPYGDGMTAWRAEVNKLARSLDPSVRDIKQQAHQKIVILKKRLTDNFQYSGVISDKYLLPLLGHCVSTRRNELINRIKAGLPRPSGMNDDVWNTLEEIAKSPNFKRKSEAMRYANSCRQTLGRTGPGSEVAIRESLKQTLCTSPDPDEVQAEMNRDKRFGGKKHMKKKVAGKYLEMDTEENDGSYGASRNLQVAHIGTASENIIRTGDVEVEKENKTNDLHLLKKLQAELDELKTRLQRSLNNPLSSNADTELQTEMGMT